MELVSNRFEHRCEICTETFHSRSKNSKFCDNKECRREAQARRQRDSRRRNKINEKVHHTDLTKSDKKYKCQKCGKDPYPNRYFCKSCHGSVSDECVVLVPLSVGITFH